MTRKEVVPVESERALAGEWFEAELITLLYEIESGNDVKDMQLGSLGAGNFDDNYPEIIARINELAEALGIPSGEWLDGVLSSEVVGDKSAGYEELTALEKRGLTLQGLSIGEFFTINMYNKLPIEFGEDDSTFSRIALLTPSDHVLYLNATGWTEFDYPKHDDEDADRESIISFDIRYSADIVKASSLVAQPSE